MSFWFLLLSLHMNTHRESALSVTRPVLTKTVSSIDTLNPEEVYNLPKLKVLVNSKMDLIAVQWKGLNKIDREVMMIDKDGKTIQKTVLFTGASIVYFDTQTVYAGDYSIIVSDGNDSISQKIKLIK